MKDRSKILKTLIFILTFVEIIGLVLFATFYYLNLYSLQSLVTTELLVLIFVCVFAFDIIVFWSSTVYFSNLKSRNDLRAAEVIGDDIQEAYNFGMIGLIVTDDFDTIIWSNDLFKQRHIDIIDTNIFAWQPSLRELKEKNSPDSVCKLIINDRNFEAKYLSEAGLWIFKDNTDFESIYKYSKAQAIVVGILSFDNFDDVIKGEEDYNDTITKVKNLIFDYAKQYGILLRRFKDSNYSMLCTHENFLKMKEDNFSIIDKVRQASENENMPLTLSIGLATDFPDVVKLNELANSALSIAMSRGGDQVVVAVYGSDMEFYGGRTEAQEKRNRVRVRVLADSLITLINNASNVLIMGHVDMDMDALGSCLGIKAICDRCGAKSQLVIDFKSTESKTRSAITSTFTRSDLDRLIVSKKEASGLVGPETLIIVVDVHIPNMVMAPDLLNLSNRIVVIDHHRRAEEYIESPVFDYIDPSASSATEIITELIRYASISPRIEVPSEYATIMLAGIFLDSDFYKSNNTGIRTFESSTILKEFGANNAIADDLLKDDYEEYIETNSIVSNVKTLEYGVVYAIADPEKVFDTAAIAKAANTCLQMKGIHAAFVIGKVGSKEIKISARSDGLVNVSLLCEKMGGGGHFTSAAASFIKSDVSDVEKILNETVSTFLKDAKNDMGKVRED